MKYLMILLIALLAGCVQTQTNEWAQYKVNDITIKWLGHSAFIVDGEKTIYFDPFVLDANPKQADYILITHEHFDHCSPEHVKRIQTDRTRIISTFGCIEKLSGKTNSIKPTESFNYTFDSIYIVAYESYNNDKSYHPRGDGVGFLVDFNGTKIYHAGDTDNVEEFANLTQEKIDVLLVPIGGKYTMNATEAAAAVKIIKPRVVIPMHFNSAKYGITDVEADAEQFKALLGGSGIDVVILKAAA
ncbi:MAG: MBL fold metallo-hydrolase [Candidatus Aenigmarchaeota archaeon]|nr:MBL fold metallo-hydrolase [Candidatus Aenigmarchaeota archaeon]